MKMGDNKVDKTSIDRNGQANKEDKEGQDSDQKVDNFSEDEEMLIARMYNLVGERWSLIAGRIPGRSAEEIEKYWTSKYSS